MHAAAGCVAVIAYGMPLIKDYVAILCIAAEGILRDTGQEIFRIILCYYGEGSVGSVGSPPSPLLQPPRKLVGGSYIIFRGQVHTVQIHQIDMWSCNASSCGAGD
jgi:hypothetical protein